MIPEGFRENLEFRGALLERANRDAEFRAGTRELFFRDPLWAFNAFFYTLDVRQKPRQHQPFCTWGFQDKMILELVDSIRSGRDLLVEKSRDMGASWIVILVFLWFWLSPEGGADFLLGSRIEDYVDKKGDMRTLFAKLRYGLYRLPRWLFPKGFEPKKHDNYLKLLNPETGSSITGESNNPNFSTGGRYLAILFDEFAKWESTDEAAWTAAGDATPCRIPVSTAFGAGGQFYKLVVEGSIKRLRLHWSLHPTKGLGAYCEWPSRLGDQGRIRSLWYDRECLRRSPEEVAQELDIDYLGSGVPVFGGGAQRRLRELLESEKKPLEVYEVSRAGLEPLSSWTSLEGCWVSWEPLGVGGYTIGVDVAEGRAEGDFSVVTMLDRAKGTVAGSFYGRIDEVELAWTLWAIQRWIGSRDLWVGIETNGPGLATFDIAAELGVGMMFMMPQVDSARETPSYRKGWRTDTISRNVLIGGVKEWLIRSEGWAPRRTVGELLSFVRGRSGRAEAKAGCHDDEVIALGIALQVHEQCPLEDRPAEGWKIPQREELLKGQAQRLEEPSLRELCLQSILRRHREEQMAWDEAEVLGAVSLEGVHILNTLRRQDESRH